MPVYEVDLPDGRTLELDAPSSEAAAEAVDLYLDQPSLGQAAAQGAARAPSTLAAVGDLAFRGIERGMEAVGLEDYAVWPEDMVTGLAAPATARLTELTPAGRYQEPVTTGQRAMEAAGEGAALGAMFLPGALAAGSAAGAGAGGLAALGAAEMAAATGPPALATALEAEELVGPRQAMAVEFAGGLSPVAVSRRVAGSAAREAASDVAQRYGRSAAAREIGPEAARRAAARLQREVPASQRGAAREALERTAELAGPEGQPLTAQVLGTLDVPGTGGVGREVASTTRALEAGNVAGFGEDVGEITARARLRGQELMESRYPAGSAEDLPLRFREEGRAARGAAQRAYEAVPGGVWADPLQTRLGYDEIAARSVGDRLVLEGLGEPNRIWQALEEAYPEGMIPVEELEGLASSLKGISRTAPGSNASRIASQWLEAVERNIDAGVERTAARESWARYKGTFEPRPPRGLREAGRAEYAAAQALRDSRGHARRILYPSGGVRPVDAARGVKQAIGDSPQAMEDLRTAFWDELFTESAREGGVAGITTLQNKLRNPRMAAAYRELFGAADWKQAKELARFHMATHWGTYGKASDAFTTGSKVAMDEAMKVGAAVARGGVADAIGIGLRVWRERFNPVDANVLYWEALKYPDLAAALLARTADPDAWAERIRTVAARRGVQLTGERLNE